MRGGVWVLVVAGVCGFASGGAGQGPAGTEIYLAPLHISETFVRVDSLINITNRRGYDNQPAFTPDGQSVLYASIDDSGQGDVLRYDISTGKTVQITRTPNASEYSPTPLPTGDGFSVILLEEDQRQRIWAYDWNGANARVIATGAEPVGYQAWGNDHTLAVFILGEPHTLRIADTRSGQAALVAYDVGRSLHKVPVLDAISYLQRDSVADSTWYIRAVDLLSRRTALMTTARPGSQDYAWTPDGRILMGQGDALWVYRPGPGARWERVPGLPAPGVRGITRLAVSPDGTLIALVAEE